MTTQDYERILIARHRLEKARHELLLVKTELNKVECLARQFDKQALNYANDLQAWIQLLTKHIDPF